jgi:plastocyanin
MFVKTGNYFQATNSGKESRVPQCNDSVTFLSRPLKLSVKHSACVFWTHLRNIPALNRRVSAALQWSKFGLLARRETSTRMKISNAARLIFGVAVFVATGFLAQAESGDRRASMSLPKQHVGAPIRILDQNGQPAVNGVRPAGGTIFDITVAPGGTFTFDPSTVNISVGDTVRWTWAASGHSVTSGDSTACTADGQFCSPNNTNCSTCVLSNVGFVYSFTFTQAGSFSYHCCVHCVIGMIGAVNVSAASPTPTPTATATATATPTATATAAASATPTVAPTATATATATAIPTGTPTAIPTATATATGTPAHTARSTPSPRPRPSRPPRP